MTNFQNYNIPEELKKSLQFQGFSTPTPIQQQTIPLALEGKDILGSAQTGTGKTLAFVLPAIVKIIANPQTHALIIAPTREIASQIVKVAHSIIGKDIKINTALLIGGDAMFNQVRALKNKAQLVVGTPGRINDHLDRGTLRLDKTKTIILDETDRMLDMGFGVQLETIFSELPEERQTLMFSATLPQEIVKVAGKYLKNPEKVSIGATSTPVAKIKQETVILRSNEKYENLVAELEKREGTVIVFVRTKISADKIADKLIDDRFEADAIHGDLRQNKRDKVLRNFRGKKFRVLVATDVAARGLDVEHIEHVINYDLPENPEDYIHRIGRTARAGAEGSAVSFVSKDEEWKWNAIQKLIDPNYRGDGPTSKPKKGKGGRSGGGGRGGFGDRRSSGGGFGGGRRDDRGGERRGGDRRSSGESRGGERGSDRGGEGRSSERRPRPEGRSEGSRFEGRSEGRSENRSENRGAERRGPDRREGGRSENRSFDRGSERGADRGGERRGSDRNSDRSSGRSSEKLKFPAKDGNSNREREVNGNRAEGERKSGNFERREGGDRSKSNGGKSYITERKPRSEGARDGRSDRKPEGRREGGRDERGGEAGKAPRRFSKPGENRGGSRGGNGGGGRGGNSGGGSRRPR